MIAQEERTAQVVSLNPLTDDCWEEFVEECDDAAPFHSRDWLGVLADAYGFEFSALCYCDSRGKLTAGIPFANVAGLTGKQRRICLPFTDRCGPIGSRREFGEYILPYAIASWEAEGINQAEIRETLGSEVGESDRFLGHQLVLEGNPQAAYRQISSSCKRAIKKAGKNGLKAVISADREMLEKFYDLHVLTRRKLGVPVQPKRFVDAIFERWVAKGRAWFSVVLRGEETIAAGLFLANRNQVIYKYGASDPRWLACRPNNLMMWKAIEHTCELGIGIFDFGRTDLHHEGLRRFKQSWGSREFEFSCYNWPEFRGSGMMRQVLGTMMPSVIRNSPKIVTRLVGEALYRYFP